MGLRLTPASLAKFGLAISLAAGISATWASSVRADVINSYSFSGTLAQDVSTLGTSVTGTFSLDITNLKLTAFSFTAPGDTIVSGVDANSQVFSSVQTTPAANILALLLYGAHDSDLDLFFETTLQGFADTALYTGPITGPDYNGATSLYLCESSICFFNGPPLNSDFTSGSTTLTGSTGGTVLPEPASLALLGVPLVALTAIRRRRPAQQA